MTTFSSDMQYMKALSPIRVTLLGMLISVIAKQLQKALLPIAVTLSPMVISSICSLYSFHGEEVVVGHISLSGDL